MKDKKLISVIVPCYNEQEVLPLFYKEITKVSGEMQNAYPELEFEYLFIDDGSKDRTLRTLRVMAKYDKRVRYISFSRNFGKEAGIYAGLSNAKGDYCVVMDADLQHPPAFLPEMYEAVSSGLYDCATTRRVNREGESKIRSWFARLFYKIMNKISQTEIVDGAQDFRFMSRQMVDAVLSMTEYNRFSKGIFSWVGFRVKYLEYENVERAAGTTAWSFWGLFRYSLEGIIGFSTFPLSFSAILGLISCALGAIMLLVTVIKKLAVGEPVAGYPTLICTLLFFGGLQLFCTGILGLYLGKTYLEVKKRPIYLSRETEADAERMLDLPETADAVESTKKSADDKADDAEDIKLLTEDHGAKAVKEDAFEKAQRLKRETDEEFDAIVESAFAGDEKQAAEAPKASDEPETADNDLDFDEIEETAVSDDETAEEAAEEAAPEQPKKPKFEVKIDYDSIDFDEDEDAADEDDFDDEYDDDYDDEYDDDYDDEFDDEDEIAAPSARKPAPLKAESNISGILDTIKEKLSGIWAKISADRTGIPEMDDPNYDEPVKRRRDDDWEDDLDDDFDDDDYDDYDDTDLDGDDDADMNDDDDSSYRGAHF